MDTTHIELRYNDLASSCCCLSCGGAIGFADVQPGDHCVDLGCGRGTDVIRMAQKTGAAGTAIGIDAADEMLAKARQNALKLSVSNAAFLKGHLESLPLEDNQKDWVISNCTINHAENKQLVWNEVFRILKPGGWFSVSDIFAFEAIAPEYSSQPDLVAECWAGAVTKDIYLDMLQSAGFVSIRIAEESAPYSKGQAKVCSFTILGQKPIL